MITTLSASIQLQDRISRPLQAITRALNITISSFEQMNRASATPINTAGLAAARNELASVGAELRRLQENMERSQSGQNGLSGNLRGAAGNIRDAAAGQRDLNNEINRGTNASNGLIKSLQRMAAVYLSIRTMGQIINLSDKMTQIEARLNLTVDDGGSVTELDQKIFESAQRARASYITTADLVSKLGQRAGSAFANNDETIQFAENLQKQFAIAGASQQEMYSANLQLTQALGSGVLRGQEFNAVFEAAPNVIQAIADYMDLPIGKMREMASDGKITADIVKNAMLGATDEINASFESMPKTFAQIWASFKNESVKLFKPVLSQLRDLANSKELAALGTGAMTILRAAGSYICELFVIIGQAGTTLYDNWSSISPLISRVGENLKTIFTVIFHVANIILSLVTKAIIQVGEMSKAFYQVFGVIEPLLYGVAAAIGVYTLATKGAAAATILFSAIQKGFALLQGIVALGYGVLTGSTAAASAATLMFNSTLLACPLMWIIMLIIGVIAVIYATVAAFNKLNGTTYSATGAICGILAVGAAFIGNLFAAVANTAFDCFAAIYNFCASFAEFFKNFLDDPVSAIVHLISNMADTVLGLLQSLAGAIDTLFGSKLADAVAGWRGSLQGLTDDLVGEQKIKIDRLDGSDFHLERFAYGESYLSGYDFGKGLSEKGILGIRKEDLFPSDAVAAVNYNSLLLPDGLGDDVKKIADNTTKVADSDALNNSNDNSALIRSAAERTYFDKTVTIKVDMINHNSINSDLDIDGIIGDLATGLEEKMAVMAEGGHI